MDLKENTEVFIEVSQRDGRIPWGNQYSTYPFNGILEPIVFLVI